MNYVGFKRGSPDSSDFAYKSIGDESEQGFCSTIAVSAETNPQSPYTMMRNILGGSKIWFLTNPREHEEFFRLATRGLEDEVHIYSPFVYKDNATARLETLANNLTSNKKLFIHTLPKYLNQLQCIVNASRTLKERTFIKVGRFHDKLIIIGQETLAVGSFNWLSGTLDPESAHTRVELSVVLQGPIAQSWIVEHFRDN